MSPGERPAQPPQAARGRRRIWLALVAAAFVASALIALALAIGVAFEGG